MVPADESDASANSGDSEWPASVYCPDCGTKASADRAFCRSCEASLDDVEPEDDTLVVRTDGEDVDLSEFLREGTGCRKCGHAESWTLRVARPISYVELALGPLVASFDTVTRRLTSLVVGDQHIEKPYVEE